MTEEPDDLIGHVRICGGAGWETAGSTRKGTRPLLRFREKRSRYRGRAAEPHVVSWRYRKRWNREEERTAMVNVSINGYKLHQVEMPLISYSENTVSYLKYPEHRIKCEIEDDKLLLRIPGFLALELYRRAILPQNPSKDVSVQINEKNIGQFVVIDFRYPHSLVQDRDTVSITLRGVGQKNVPT
jgi:hypothetical protein